MEDTDIIEISGREGIYDPLTDMLRKGARQLIQSAVEGELATFPAQFAEDGTATGHAAIVRNGYHPERAIQTGIGPVTVRIPKVRSKRAIPSASTLRLSLPMCARQNLSRLQCPGCI